MGSGLKPARSRTSRKRGPRKVSSVRCPWRDLTRKGSKDPPKMGLLGRVDSNHRLPDPESGQRNLRRSHESGANSKKRRERGRFKGRESGELSEEQCRPMVGPPIRRKAQSRRLAVSRILCRGTLEPWAGRHAESGTRSAG